MPNGKILFYNSSNGKGKVITENEEVFDFSADNWKGFEVLPDVKIEVVVEIKDGAVVSLRATEESVANESRKNSSLKPTFSVSECIRTYFEPIDFLMDKPPAVVNTNEQLDFFKTRRFLLTAYNDLKSIDSSLHKDKHLIDMLDKIENLYKSYKVIESHAKQKKLAFEVIFLRSQPEYLKFIKYKEQCLSRISALTHQEEALFPKIKEMETNLKKLKNDGKSEKSELERLEQEIKKVKKMYVDTIHDNAQIGEELLNMSDLKNLYTEQYYDEFIYEFGNASNKYLESISKILNYKTYTFDSILWKRARLSKSINDFFDEANIDGEYSTATFLRYYLNTLDKSKASDDQKELFKLLDYLESLE
jgi:archaellum component FlaC